MIQDKGLYLDCNAINQPPGTWRDAKNILFSKIKSAITNEDGTLNISIPTNVYNTQPIGSRAFPDGSKLIWSAGVISRIGIVDKNDIYTDLIIDNILNFSLDHPIRKSEIEYNFLGERIIAWTDFFNTPKILNIDTLPFTLNGSKGLTNPSDILDIEIFTTFDAPNFSFTISQTGGNVRSGNYSVCLAYENNDGTVTPNSIPIKNICITDDPTSVGYYKFDGVKPDTLTGKSINFTITNVDTHYDKLILIIVAKRNGIVSAFEVKKVNITSSVVNISYLGNEVEVPMDLTQILTPKPIYSKVGSMTQLNGKLYLAKLETNTEIDFQQYANNIRIFYNTNLVIVDTIAHSQKDDAAAGFSHGGVYAFYITLILTNGSKSRSFHIPGRGVLYQELPAPTITSSIGAAEGISCKAFQIEDTTNRGGHSYSTTINSFGELRRVTDTSVGSNMGFWENQDETYPTNFPTLAGLNVRHHVFPTIRECKSRHYSSRATYGTQYFDILGIDVVNVNIPDALKPFIKGWYISYAKRDYVNSNTLGTDIYLTGHLSKTDNNHYSSGGGNWTTRAITSGGGDWSTGFKPDPFRLRGHNFDLLYDKPNLGSSLFIDFELKFKKSNLINSFLTFGKAGGNLASSGKDEGQNAGAVIDLTDLLNTTVTQTATSLIRRITEYKYLPTGIIDGNYRTIKNEEAIHMTVANSIPFSVSEVHVNQDIRTPGAFIQNSPSFTNGGEETYLITYKQVKNNVYNNFDQQLLITTNEVNVGTGTFKLGIYGGDHFLSVRSFICSSQRYVNDIELNTGTTVIRAHVSENRHNIGLRYEIIGDVNSKYYPKTSAQNFWSDPSNPDENGVSMIFDRLQNMNGTLGYSEDYNSINDLNQTVIFNVGQITTNKFPYRVIRSGFSGATQTSLNSWKTYLSADFYESNRNRGAIENIETLDDTLLIHHLYGLFYTLGSQKLALGATEVFLGTSDIFSQVPKEPVSTELGFLGCQNIYSTLSFKGSYGWCDQSQGRIFIMSKQGVKEISNIGLYNFFRDNLKINNDLPNSPITGECIVAGFDPKYNRLLFTKNSISNSFTISYSIDANFWVSYHTYKPLLYSNSTTEFYAIAATGLFKMNNSLSKAKYFNTTINSSYIDLVFNQFPNEVKIFYNINWISEMFNSTNLLIRDKTLSNITILTNFQTSGNITLAPHTSFNNKGNIRKLRNKWNFNKFKDSNISPLKKRPIVSEYSIIRYEYSNVANLDSTQNSLYLYLLSCNFRKA